MRNSRDRDPLYLDYNATTPVDPRVLEVMLPYFSHHFGNPASAQHHFGWEAKKAVERARTQVAELVDAHPKEIFFTSGATESINLALKGILQVYAAGERKNVLTSALEHRAVLATLAEETRGAPDTLLTLPTDATGRALLEPLADLRGVRLPLLVSLAWANNEVGTLNPIHDVAQWTRENDVFFHCDGAQALGHHPLSLRDTPVDLMSFSAHKIYGPKGAGALFVRKKSPRIRLQPQIHGGGQELGLRAGTLNVPAIVGFGEACEIMRREGLVEADRLARLRNALYEKLNARIPGLKLNGPALRNSERLCNNLSVVFPQSTRVLLPRLAPFLAVSSGSACLTQDSTAVASHVLQALGLTPADAGSTLRLSVGRGTTDADIDEAVELIARAVLRSE